MTGQSLILGVGAIAYPPERQGSDPEYLAMEGVSKVLTLSSTYDHRVVQGADSGRLLARIAQFLTGADGFYEEIFSSLGIRYTPFRWAQDDWTGPTTKVGRQAGGVSRLIPYRTGSSSPTSTRSVSIRRRSIELDPGSTGSRSGTSTGASPPVGSPAASRCP